MEIKVNYGTFIMYVVCLFVNNDRKQKNTKHNQLKYLYFPYPIISTPFLVGKFS